MEHYLEHTNYLIWEVIQKGNGPVQVSTDTHGQIRVLPPKTTEEILAKERERKARTTLLMAIPEDHLAKFHKIIDAKEIRKAIKSKFGGNDESKKMQKYIQKQQFKSFSVSNSEGLHKGYDRFQSLLSQLETHGADVSTKDANQKFLRSLPSSWSQNVAFVSSDSTSSTNEVNIAYGVSTSSGHNSQREGSSSYTDELMYSFFANQSGGLKLYHEDLAQLDEFDLEEMDLKWQEPISFDKTKVECFNCHNKGHFARECRSKGNQERMRDARNTGHKARDNRRRPAKSDEPKAMVTIDGEGVDWTGHAKDDTEDYALMAFNSNNLGSDTKVTSCSKECENTYAKLKKLYDEKREQLGVANIEIQAYTLALKRLGYGTQIHEGVLSYENEVLESVFDNRPSDIEDSPMNDRFAKVKGMHAVLPPMTGIYMPPKSNFVIDESKLYMDNPHQTLKGKGIVDTGCSRNMTGNKAYLVEYQDINGGHVAFGENEANKTAGPQEANNSAGTQDNLDAGNFEMEAEHVPKYFVLPLWSSYTSTVKCSTTKNGDEKLNEDTGSKTNKEKTFPQSTEDLLVQAGAARDTSTNYVNTASTPINITSTSVKTANLSRNIPSLDDIYKVPNDGIFTSASYDAEGAVVDFTNFESIMNVSPIPQSRIHSIHPTTQILGDPNLAVQTRSKVNKKPKKISQALKDESWVDAMQEELLQFKTRQVWILVDFPFGRKVIKTKWVYMNKKDKRGVVRRNKERLVAQGHRQEEGIDYDVVFSHVARIEAIRIFLAFASYMGFILYQMNVKSAFLYEEAPRAWYATLSTFLVKSGYRRGIINKTLFIKKDQKDIMLTDSTPIETKKPLVKDAKVADVDVHPYRSMIGSLIYSTASRPDIVYAVYACFRFQVTLKTLHLQALKRIFRYLKGQPKLGNLQHDVVNFLSGDLLHGSEKSKQLWLHLLQRHHFIRDAYEKKLIQVLNIHTDDSVADLLTNAFDVSRQKVSTARSTISNVRAESLVLSPDFKLPDENQCSTTKNKDEKLNEDAGSKTYKEPVDQEDQAFLEELERLKQQKKEADDAAKTLRKMFAQSIEDLLVQAGAARDTNTNYVNTASTPVNTASTLVNIASTSVKTANLSRNVNAAGLSNINLASYDAEGAVADFTNFESTMNEELLQFKTQQVWILVDLPFKKNVIGTKWVYMNKKDKRGVVGRNKERLVAQGHRQKEGIDYDVVFSPVARIEAIRIFLAFASYMGFIVYQMNVKSAFLYEEALYGLHQALRAWYATLSTFLMKSGYRRGIIDKTLFIKKDQKDIMLVPDKFYGWTHFISWITSQVEKRWNFISQDKYVAEILKKFDFISVKTASTLIETKKHLVKDAKAADVDVHPYRSMIGSLIYSTASRTDIMYAVYACSWFQVTLKTSHLQALKRIFRKSTTRDCQFLGRRLITWKCKKQTIMATSTTEAEYAAAINCYGQGEKAKTRLNIKEGNFNKLDDLVGEDADYAVNEWMSNNKIKVLNAKAEGVSAADETLSTATLAVNTVSVQTVLVLLKLLCLIGSKDR
nr:hypothetical protein [Tanacetum cinerariifolium]